MRHLSSAARGVGEALHQLPPAWAEYVNTTLAPPQGADLRTILPAVTREQLDEVCTNAVVNPTMSGINDDRCPLDRAN